LVPVASLWGRRARQTGSGEEEKKRKEGSTRINQKRRKGLATDEAAQARPLEEKTTQMQERRVAATGKSV